MVYPKNGTVVDRFYTGRGQLKDVGWGAGATSYVYWPDGKVDYQARTNGVTTRYGYDGRGMISSVLHESGQSLAFREYWRDNWDRIVAWKRGTAVGGPNGMENGRGDRYAYDPEGQLTQASYRAFLGPEPELTPSDAKRSDSFQYDALGNRYGSNRIASRGIYLDFTRRNNGLNQYHMWSPYSGLFYDDNFNANWQYPGNGVMMADGYFTASYNALNQPVAMGSQGLGSNFYWFWHDPLGRCVKRWLGNGSGVPAGPITYLYYDGWSLVQEGPNASTADRLYVHGGRVDEILASKLGGQWYNHHYDARGHCILLTNSSGAIQEQYDYDAFGMPYSYNAAGTSLGNFGGVGNRFLFTGREWIKDLRVYDYRHRMYQPELGRFLQPDPKQFEAGDYNLYRYCHNDPVNKSDPMGLEVNATFYRSLGVLTLTDMQTGQTIIVNKVFSGNGAFTNNPAFQGMPNQGPIAGGTYLIGTGAERRDHVATGDAKWYPLYGQDGKGGFSYQPVPVIDPLTGNTVLRGGGNIHTGLQSDGCVTIPSDVPPSDASYPTSADFNKVKDLLDNTKPIDRNGQKFTGKLMVK